MKHSLYKVIKYDIVYIVVLTLLYFLVTHQISLDLLADNKGKWERLGGGGCVV